MTTNKKVLKCLMMAQAWSDQAKNQNDWYKLNLNHKKYGTYEKYDCYIKKDDYIFKAIQLIESGKTGVYYYIERRPDQNGHMSNILYFSFKINGKRYQISFHNFRREIKKRVGNGSKQYWDQKSSQESALAIKRFLDK